MYPSLDACVLDWVPGLKDPRTMPGLVAYYDTLVSASVVQADAVNRVSAWQDLSGLGHHLVQVFAASQPVYTPQAGAVLPYITFDGISQFLKTAPFTLAQPEWVVVVAKAPTWTLYGTLFDGNAGIDMDFYQRGGSPGVVMTSIVTSLGPLSYEWPLNTNAVISAVFNGPSSKLQINRGSIITGNVGAGNAGGFTLGCGGGLGYFGNYQVQGVAIFSIHPTQAQIDMVTRWASRRYSIAI